MTQPGPARPVPGPPRPAETVPVGDAAIESADPGDARPTTEGSARPGDPFAGLAGRPLAEHVAVFEAEHARLERELGTIDRL